MASAPPPAMTVDRAKLIINDSIEAFTLPENRDRLQNAIAETTQLPPEQQPMARMQKLMPIVAQIAGPKLAHYGLPNVMVGVMQLQQVQDPLVSEGVQILSSASMGKPVDDAYVADYLQRLKASS